MRLVRTILAFAIAVSLAVLPIGASAGGFAMSSDDMQTSMQMGGTGMSMDDCCPDGMNGKTSDTADYKRGMGFCCAGGTVALGDLRGLAFKFLAMPTIKVPLAADQIVSLHLGSPPFRPPRV